MLTPQEIDAARKQIGLTPPTQNSAAAEVARRRQLAAEYDAAQEAQKSYTEKTASNLGNTVKEGISKISQDFQTTMNKTSEPTGTGERILNYASGAGHLAGDVAGTIGGLIGSFIEPVLPEGVKKTLGNVASFVDEKVKSIPGMTPEIEQALGDVFNTVSLLGGGKVKKPVASTVAKIGENVVQKTENLVKNVTPKLVVPVEKSADAIRNVRDYAFTQATGLQPETLKLLVEHPEKYKAAELGGLSRATMADKVKLAFDKRLEDFSELGKAYDKVRNSNETVTFKPQFVENILNKYGLQIDKKGKILSSSESVPLQKGDIADLENFIKQYNPKNPNSLSGLGGTGSPEMTSNAFLNARAALDNLANWEGNPTKSKVSEAISKDLRHAFDEQGKKQLTGLSELDAQYAPEAEILKKLKRDFLNADGTLKDSALNKVANLTGKGKDLQLERVKQLLPGIEEEARILKAIEDVEYASGRAVGSYARGAAGGIGFATGNIPLILGAVVTSPKILVPMILKYGPEIKKINVESLIEKIKAGRKLSMAEKGAVKTVIEKAANAIGNVSGATAIEVTNQLKNSDKKN